MAQSATDAGLPGPTMGNIEVDSELAALLGSDTLTSGAPLVEKYGNITEIWPDGCNNDLPALEKNQERNISSVFLKDTISM
jgi:hypothetical protein